MSKKDRKRIRGGAKNMGAAAAKLQITSALDLTRKRIQESHLRKIDEEVLLDVLEEMTEKKFPQEQVVEWIERSIQLRKSFENEHDEIERGIDALFARKTV